MGVEGGGKGKAPNTFVVTSFLSLLCAFFFISLLFLLPLPFSSSFFPPLVLSFAVGGLTNQPTSQLSVISSIENETVVDELTVPSHVVLASESTRFRQTSVGAFFCSAIKDELNVDVSLLNGVVIKGGDAYKNNRMTYAQLQKELHFSTKIVVAELTLREIKEPIWYSRNCDMEGQEEGVQVRKRERDREEERKNGERQEGRRGLTGVTLERSKTVVHFSALVWNGGRAVVAAVCSLSYDFLFGLSFFLPSSHSALLWISLLPRPSFGPSSSLSL